MDNYTKKEWQEPSIRRYFLGSFKQVFLPDKKYFQTKRIVEEIGHLIRKDHILLSKHSQVES